MSSDSTIDATIQDTVTEPVEGRPTQTHCDTRVSCDVQKAVGSSWRSVYIARHKDTDDPDTAVREWLAANREPGANYRIARSIRTVIITVDPA